MAWPSSFASSSEGINAVHRGGKVRVPGSANKRATRAISAASCGRTQPMGSGWGPPTSSWPIPISRAIPPLASRAARISSLPCGLALYRMPRGLSSPMARPHPVCVTVSPDAGVHAPPRPAWSARSSPCPTPLFALLQCTTSPREPLNLMALRVSGCTSRDRSCSISHVEFHVEGAVVGFHIRCANPTREATMGSQLLREWRGGRCLAHPVNRHDGRHPVVRCLATLPTRHP